MSETTDAKITDWRVRLDPMLAGLQDFILGPDEPLDCSAESLREVEDILLSETPPGAAPPEGLSEAAGGYLGEALLTAGGGAWTWDEASDLPAVRLDPALDLTIEPMRLVLDAVLRRSGSVWSDELARVETAVADRRLSEPGWHPVRTDKPALQDAVSSSTAADPWLEDWLATRREQFDSWAVSAGAPADLDFTPESLHQLERLLRARVASVDDLKAAEHDDFVQGAMWYLGEVARRHRDARWHYVPLDPDATGGPNSRANPFAGAPYVAQDPPSEGAAVPMLELRAALRTDETGVLSERFEEFD
ncbi:MAG TPA: hypothetical protein VNP20_21210 [Nocardioidaceae bacterium]|nr:hypothetical protein [Nocardioidaceae bacterium]